MWLPVFVIWLRPYLRLDKNRVSISGQKAPEWDYFMEQIMISRLNNPSTILLSQQVCNALFSDMKHIQVKCGVDRLWSLLTQEGHIHGHTGKQWEKQKIECKPDKLAPGYDHLPKHNIWKIQVYLKTRIMESWILWLSLKSYARNSRFIC